MKGKAGRPPLGPDKATKRRLKGKALLALGQNTMKLRNQLGWTRQQVADKAKLSLNTVTRVENVERDVMLSVVQHLADAFSVTPSSLLED